MPVNQNRPFERHMVTNIPNLLAAGQSLSALATGQIGIFDAKTNLSVTAPTYQTNKVIYFAQGTPDHSGFTEGAGVPNMYRKSQPIQGKSLISLRGKAASRGRGEIVTLGYDGSDASKTLTAKPGDVFYYWVRLTGDPIFNLNPDRAKGVIIEGAVSMPCLQECSDNCTTVSCNTIADRVIEDLIGHPDPQFSSDPNRWVGGKFLPGGQRAFYGAGEGPHDGYVRVSKVTQCDQPTPYEFFTEAVLDVPDNGTQSDLGLVQAQYPGISIFRKSRFGIVSKYVTLVEVGTTLANYVQAGATIITDCNTCPVGSTYIPALDQFQVTITANGATNQASTITTKLHSFSDVAVSLLQIDSLTGTATYQINILAGTASTASVQAALTGLTGVVTIVTQVGTSGAGCLLPASTFDWAVSTCADKATFLATYTLTLKDQVCGNCEGSFSADSSGEGDETYYTQIYNLYVASGLASSLTVSEAGVNCTRLYTLTVISYPGEVGCTTEKVQFPIVPDFNEQRWLFQSVVGATDTGCVCGIQLESHFIPRLENECTFGYFTRQYDWVHIEISSHNPDWRSTDLCEQDPKSTRIQNGAYPNGDGSAVVRIEKADRMYDMDYWYLAPNLREAFDFYFEARFDSYYDMVAVEYEFSYSSNQFFGQTDHDRYIQFFWLPEGTTGQLTTALNTYAASANINIDPVVI